MIYTENNAFDKLQYESNIKSGKWSVTKRSADRSGGRFITIPGKLNFCVVTNKI